MPGSATNCFVTRRSIPGELLSSIAHFRFDLRNKCNRYFDKVKKPMFTPIAKNGQRYSGIDIGKPLTGCCSPDIRNECRIKPSLNNHCPSVHSIQLSPSFDEHNLLDRNIPITCFSVRTTPRIFPSTSDIRQFRPPFSVRAMKSKPEIHPDPHPRNPRTDCERIHLLLGV